MKPAEPFRVSRLLDAPRALVFLAHTDVAQLAGWMGAAGSTTLRADLDLKPGGIHHYGVRMPDGSEMWGRQVFQEIKAPEKIVHLQSFSDALGEPTRHPMAPTWPLEMLATTEFRDAGHGRTELSISWSPHRATEEEARAFDQAREGMAAGWKASLDRLEAHLKGNDRVLFHSRMIAAPRERIWQALIDPSQVNTWWGPNGFRNTEVAQEVRVGGIWRFKMIGPDGTVYPNHVQYLEIAENRRLHYDHGDGKDVLFRGAIDLEDIGGKTLVTLTLTVPSKEARDGYLASGAIEGGQQTLAKLEAFVR